MAKKKGNSCSGESILLNRGLESVFAVICPFSITTLFPSSSLFIISAGFLLHHLSAPLDPELHSVQVGA